MPIYSSKPETFESLAESSYLNEYEEQLHLLLQNYLLTKEQLLANKYPLPESVKYEASCPTDLVKRKCFRCQKVFYVTLDGSYASSEKCSYHSKPCKYRAGLSLTSLHSCCFQPIGYPGCTTHNEHVCAEPILNYSTFKSITDERRILNNQVFALDCEMVVTSAGLQVAKVAVVNHIGLTVYETFVLPENKIIDYCTKYSGVTPKDLQGLKTKLVDVQEFLNRLLSKDSILIGHGLNGDLNVLRLMHDKIIDTSVMFPRTDGSKQKLKYLAHIYLDENIQSSPNGHDCVEDARTCMSLVLYKLQVDQPGLKNYLEKTQRKIQRHCVLEQLETANTNSLIFCKIQHPPKGIVLKNCCKGMFPKEMMERSAKRKFIHEQIKSKSNVLWLS